MAKRLAELGALQDAVSNDEAAPKRLGLAGYIRGLFLDWSANPYNPLTRLSARGRLLGYFWDSGAIGLSMNFADQNYLIKEGTVKSKLFSDIVNFSRTTNATVTNSAGLITYAPHNLLVASEQFDNVAWTKTTTTVTANVIVAPDNTTTADTLTASGANSTTLHSYTAIAQPYVFSIYIKRRTGTGNIQITADGSTYSTVAITSNWARYETTVTPTAGTRTPGVRIVTSGDAIDVWGADLEIGSTATTYNSTTVKNLLGYSELFDNSAWTKSNSFVQTNLLTFSEDLSNAIWFKTRASATSNVITAPNGYLTADKLIEDTTVNNTHIVTQNYITSALAYTYSVYAKAGERTWIRLDNSSVTNATAFFDLATGVVGTVGATATATILSVGNGWYRCSITATATAASNTFKTALSLDGSTVNYTGDGVSGVYLWGAQLVQGSVAGDYRRTDAAALPVYYPNHNGVVVAEKLVETTANARHVLYQDVTTNASTPLTISFYAKAAERSFVTISGIFTGISTGFGLIFDLTNGVCKDLSTSKGSPVPSIAPVGNGWFRCSVQFTQSASELINRFIFAPSNSYSPSIDGSFRVATYTGDGTSGIYIFGAQLSNSASLDPYVLNAAAAPTAAAFYGARFDYDPVTLAPKGLLIEEQRSNLLLNSAIAGTNLATQNVTVTAVAHTLSFYGTGNIVLSGTASATLTGTGAYPTRSTLTFTPTAGTLTLTVTGTVQYAQLEIGSFATSFIPTAASQVTRAADVATIQGSNFFSWYNQNEGSFTVSPTNIATTGNRIPWEVNDNTANNRVRVFINTTTSTWTLQATSSGVAGPASTPSVALQTVKIASGLKSFDFAQVVNTALVSNTTALIPVISTQLQIGIGQTGAGSQFNGTIKQISYYPQRLSNDVLKGLTA